MALGLFKKKESADTIYYNGHIYTQDPAFPWASAVACKNGTILAVGDYDYMSSIISDDTQVFDLSGNYMLPGFIDAFGSPCLQCFDELYLRLDPSWGLNTLLKEIKYYIDDSSENEIIFGYGYSEQVINMYNDPNPSSLLDSILDTRPIVMVSSSGLHCWLNSFAKEQVTEAAKEECINYITVDYVLNYFLPFSFEEIDKNVNMLCENYTDKGFTSFFNMLSPDCFDSLFQDSLISMINEDKCKLKYYGSLLTTNPVNPEALLYTLRNNNTNCMEMNGYINYNSIKIVLPESNSSDTFPQKTLENICLTVADNGFNIHIDAYDIDSLMNVYSVFNSIRSKGYKKPTLVIASDLELNEEQLQNFGFSDTFIKIWGSDTLNKSVFDHCINTVDVIDYLTIKAAKILGISGFSGSIEQGKSADFVIYECNPLELSINTFSKIHSEIVILNGEIVYNAEDAAKDEMYNLLLSQQL